MLKDTLEIILITYNRKARLQKTFDQIFADNSPIKDLQITILNNKSTDGSTELIQEYAKKFPNIKHTIHNRNIGGNANIARAFETASLKYFWILCDDDEYKWDNWKEVEEAIEQDNDAIVVTNYLGPKNSVPALLKQMTFVPSTIYKTENITDTVLINAEYSIYTMFSQLAINCYLLNHNKKIHICDDWIVNLVLNLEDCSYTKGCDENVHPYYKQNFWQIGYLNTVQMIKDKKLREEILYNFDVDGDPFFAGLKKMFLVNTYIYKNSFKNISDSFAAFDFKQRLIFIIAYFAFLFDDKILIRVKKIINFYKTEKGFYLTLFNKIKIKLISFKVKEEKKC